MCSIRYTQACVGLLASIRSKDLSGISRWHTYQLEVQTVKQKRSTDQERCSKHLALELYPFKQWRVIVAAGPVQSPVWLNKDARKLRDKAVAAAVSLQVYGHGS